MKSLSSGLYSLFFAFLLITAPVVADDSRPVFVAIEETHAQVYRLHWQIPATIAPKNWPSFLLPSHCGDAATIRSSVGRQVHRCGETLAGAALKVAYPQWVPSNGILLKFTTLAGEQHTALLSAGDTEWTIPLAETTSRIAGDYTVLGIQHILKGWDHLLFIVCLLWIAGDIRRLLLTITGFTLAHSLTLGLAALNVIQVPVAPVEALIALSVVFLAAEIVKHRRDGERKSLTWRHPIVVSSLLGLLHGLGFAAVLNEIGLPQTEVLTALVFFNIGVEIGQVMFAFSVMVLVAVFKPWRARAVSPLIYLMGAVAAFWFVERSVVMFA